jgi:hypothetical protein
MFNEYPKPIDNYVSVAWRSVRDSRPRAGDLVTIQARVPGRGLSYYSGQFDGLRYDGAWLLQNGQSHSMFVVPKEHIVQFCIIPKPL